MLCDAYVIRRAILELSKNCLTAPGAPLILPDQRGQYPRCIQAAYAFPHDFSMNVALR